MSFKMSVLLQLIILTNTSTVMLDLGLRRTSGSDVLLARNPDPWYGMTPIALGHPSSLLEASLYNRYICNHEAAHRHHHHDTVTQSRGITTRRASAPA